jgi:hypothetical protein
MRRRWWVLKVGRNLRYEEDIVRQWFALFDEGAV